MPTQARDPLNPYVVGPAIKEEYGFYGRHNLVEAVVKVLTTTQQNSIVLHGQRRIGKSSLLHRLWRDETLKQAHVPIFFDLQLRQRFPLARILADLASAISDQLNLSVPLPDEASLAADYHQFQRVFLSEVYQSLGDKRLLILFDEFDVVVPADIADAYPADTLLGYLQYLIEEDHQRLVLVFAVGQRLDLLAEGYRRLFKGARTEPVGRLGKEDAYALLTELGGRGGISYTHEALDEIWALTNGHPYLTQLMGSEVFEHLQNQEANQASVADVDACLNPAMEHGLGGLDWFWRSFGREEQLVLAAIADLSNRHTSIDDAEVDASLQEHGLMLTEVDRRRAYSQLIQGDFLHDTGGRRYQFAVEFIRLWIVKDHPLKEVKNRLEQGSPEARSYYQLGLQAYQKGHLNEAIKHYRQAIKHDPDFPGPRLALARVLFAQDEIQAAIKEYEEAYRLDPIGAREELIEIRLGRAYVLAETGDDKEALSHTQRVLQIDPHRPEARQLLADIYLRQAAAYLEDFNLTQAQEKIRNLIQPVSVINDPGVGQRVRDLWLRYSRRLTQRKPPNWDEAQRALRGLESFELLGEAAIAFYNQIGLTKARDSLERDRLDQTLDTLEHCLLPPIPQEDIREMLERYSRRQIEAQRWHQAATAHEGLLRFVDDEQCYIALFELYRQWGDTRLKEGKFEKAIDVYQRGKNASDGSAFEQKIMDAYLRKASWHLEQHELADAELSYRQALEMSDAAAVRQQARDELETYFNGRRDGQDWERASRALTILEALGLAVEALPAMRTDLQLSRAQAELEQGPAHVAFRRLATLGGGASGQIKSMIRVYLRQKGRNGQWAAGSAALKQLSNLLTDDTQPTHWRANWLFLWAQALYPKAKAEKRPTRAKSLCRGALELAPEGTPLIDLLEGPIAATESEAQDLRHHGCALYTDITLAQAQNCLERADLTQAQTFFAEALDLRDRPAGLPETILARLQGFSQDQMNTENWELARDALDIARKLGVGDQEINRSLAGLAISQALQMFKADRMKSAFSILKHLVADIDITPEERHQVKSRVHQFSRLYAGRDRWDDARRTLHQLRKWLAPYDEEEMASLLDRLNHEHYALINGKRLSFRQTKVSPEEIAYLKREIEAAKTGSGDAQVIGKLTPEATSTWLNLLIEAHLELGRAYLTNDELEAAIQTYKDLLDIESDSVDHKAWISQSLYIYSDRMLDQQKWTDARQTLEELKSLQIPAPGSEICPDPRADGAIQRVLLEHARVLLEKDQIEKTFSQLRSLPQPWPEGEIKDIVRNYSQTRRQMGDWRQAIDALRRLDQLLASDREQAHEQQALGWLVDDLEKWGQYLEENEEFEEAAEAYREALANTYLAAQPRNIELAERYIQVILRRAGNQLKRDPLTEEPPPAIAEAINGYQEILSRPEHTPEHERQINQAVHNHALKLAETGQWGRAQEMLDHLDDLYPTPKDHDKAQFAIWRRDLALNEVRARLGEGQVALAFQRLTRLKTWLNNYGAPKAGWPDNKNEIKNLVYEFCEGWLSAEEWDMAVQALAHLAHLLPDDSEIKGRQVSALVDWGTSWQKHNNPTEALLRYERALVIAPEQDLIPITQIEEHLLATRLAQARQHLDRRELTAALAVYEQVLQQPGHHPGLTDKIRHALKSYSDSLIKESPPDWGAAGQALASLIHLKLDTPQVFEWRQALALKEIRARLQQDDLEATFTCLEAMERPWPVQAIQEIVHNYRQTRAKPDTWRLAIRVLKRLGAILAEDASAREWVVRELLALGEELEAQGSPGATQAFEAAVSLN